MMGIIMVLVAMFALMALPMIIFDRELTYLLFQFGYPIACFLALGGILAFLILSRGPARKLFRAGKGLLVWMVSEAGETELLNASIIGVLVQFSKNHFGALPKSVKGSPVDILNKRFTIKELGRPMLYGYSSKSILYTPEHIRLAKQAEQPTEKQQEILDDLKRLEGQGAKVDATKNLLLTELELQDPRDIVNLVEETWPDTILDEAVYKGKQLERESRGIGTKMGPIIGLVVVIVLFLAGIFILTDMGVLPS